MKFIIDGKEIKTIIKDATIYGSKDLVSRTAVFSYLYDSSFELYKAKLNSKVLIKDDIGDNIFQGNVKAIYYSNDKKIVKIQAQDLLYPLLNTKIKGRFKGIFLNILSTLVKDFEIVNTARNYLSQDINILSLGKFTVYDIISIAAKKIYGEEVKIYLDGNSRLKFLLPDISSSKGTYTLGKDIISASFTSLNGKNISSIKAIGNKDIVSGSVIEITDEKNKNKGHFVVTKDKHIYGNIYTMDLELMERKV